MQNYLSSASMQLKVNLSDLNNKLYCKGSFLG